MNTNNRPSNIRHTDGRVNMPPLTAKQQALLDYYHARRAIYPIRRATEVAEIW